MSPHGLEWDEEVRELGHLGHNLAKLLRRAVHRRPDIFDEDAIRDECDQQNGEEVISFAPIHNGLGFYPVPPALSLVVLRYTPTQVTVTLL